MRLLDQKPTSIFHPVLRRGVTCFFVISILVSTARSQYRFDQWTADTGLPQNSVRAILQTRDGYLWVVTLDGIARFDGVRFMIFDRSNNPWHQQQSFHRALRRP